MHELESDDLDCGFDLKLLVCGCGMLVVLIFVVLTMGLMRATSPEAQRLREQARVARIAREQSLIGKRVITISDTTSKPLVITVEGGGRIEVDCHKYSLQTTVTGSTTTEAEASD